MSAAVWQGRYRRGSIAGRGILDGVVGMHDAGGVRGDAISPGVRGLAIYRRGRVTVTTLGKPA